MMEVDHEQSEMGEIVTVGAANNLMQSLKDATQGAPPAILIQLAHHMRFLQGQYFFLKSSQLTQQYIDGHGLDEVENDPELMEAVNNYHSYVNAHLIKKNLQMHPFLSNYSADIFKRKSKNHPVARTLSSVFDVAEKLNEACTCQKERLDEYVDRNLEHTEFHDRRIQEIDDHRATLQEQNVDKAAKEMVVKKKSEVRFMAELSSRLLAVTLLDTDVLVDILINVSAVLDHVS